MILVDTSVWVDHLRAGDKKLTALLEAGGHGVDVVLIIVGRGPPTSLRSGSSALKKFRARLTPPQGAG